MRFNSEEMGRFSTASLITRTTNDITQVQTIIAMGLQALIKAPILLIWAVCKISNKQWQWSAATAGAVFIILVILMIAVILALPKFQIIQKLTDNLNRVTRENLTGIRVVRAYNAESFQEEKFEKANIFQHIVSCIWVTETDATKFDFTLAGQDLTTCRPIFHPDFCIKHLVDTANRHHHAGEHNKHHRQHSKRHNAVESNVAYGDNGRSALQRDAVTEAISMAQASEFVEKMTGGLSARIAQGIFFISHFPIPPPKAESGQFPDIRNNSSSVPDGFPSRQFFQHPTQ